MPRDISRELAEAQRLLERGRLREAVRVYERAFAESSDPRVGLKLGDLLVRTGPVHEAVRVWRRVAESYAGESFALKAIAVYKQIVSVDPRELDDQLALAELYAGVGLATDAASSLVTAARALSQMPERGSTEISNGGAPYRTAAGMDPLARLVSDVESLAARIAKVGGSDAAAEVRALRERLRAMRVDA